MTSELSSRIKHLGEPETECGKVGDSKISGVWVKSRLDFKQHLWL